MSRIAVRRAAAPSPAFIAGTIVLGFGLGAALGFVLGEFAGPAANRALREGKLPAPKARPLVSRLVDQAQAALDDDLLLRDCELRVLAVGPGRIELHGWVPSRRTRARAAHLVSDAVEADAIINCLLVRGEDDLMMDDDASDELMA